jgi:hypothetical protein
MVRPVSAPPIAGMAAILGVILLAAPVAARIEGAPPGMPRANLTTTSHVPALSGRSGLGQSPVMPPEPRGGGNLTAWQAMETPRAFPGLFDPSLATDPADGLTVMFGGCPGVTCSGTSYSNATWAYAAGVWEQLNLTTSPPGRTTAQMTWDPAANEVILFGGEG